MRGPASAGRFASIVVGRHLSGAYDRAYRLGSAAGFTKRYRPCVPKWGDPVVFPLSAGSFRSVRKTTAFPRLSPATTWAYERCTYGSHEPGVCVSGSLGEKGSPAPRRRALSVARSRGAVTIDSTRWSLREIDPDSADGLESPSWVIPEASGLCQYRRGSGFSAQVVDPPILRLPRDP